MLSAEALVRRAAANGVSLFSLTDHDDLGGLAAARAVADQVGMQFVTGVEISVEWGGLQVHVLGYNFDAADAKLNAGLQAIRTGSIERALRMGVSLSMVGVHCFFEGEMRFA